MATQATIAGNGVSENVSEKKQRGRPRLLHKEWEAAIRRAGRQYSSTRTVQNDDYESRAFTVLGLSTNNPPDFPYRWLCDPSKVKYGSSQRQAHRKTILVELGRIADDNMLRHVALEICRLQPKTQEAIRLIRRVRLGKSPKAEQASLEDTIWRAINEYKSKHPTLTEGEVWRTVSAIDDTLSEKMLEREYRAALG